MLRFQRDRFPILRRIDRVLRSADNLIAPAQNWQCLEEKLLLRTWNCPERCAHIDLQDGGKMW